MKIRESGMPDCNMWEKFFDPEKILATMEIDSQTDDSVKLVPLEILNL